MRTLSSSGYLRSVADTSISGRRVVRELADLIAERGKPRMIVSENGTNLSCNSVLAWCRKAGINWHKIAPGKPMQHGYAQTCNGKIRDVYLWLSLLSAHGRSGFLQMVGMVMSI
jgi:transposase InsO family protein